MLTSHLSVLKTAASLYPTAPVFTLPILDQHTGHVQHWSSVTYQQFQDDVQLYSKYWSRILRQDNIPQRSVIGLWIGGYTYNDVLHIYGISRAGYIPQLFSLRLPNPDVVFELLHKAQAQALVFDASYENVLSNCPVPTHLACEAIHEDLAAEPLPHEPTLSFDDIAFVFHTSGSTSGSPKLVRCNYRWLSSAINKSYQIMLPLNPNRQDVTTWMGSMCHIGQTFMLLGSLQHGTCTIQPTTISFDVPELVDMVQRCRLNRFNQFAAFLAMRLRAARQDPKLLSLLTSLDAVVYSGMPLSREDEEFACASGIRLTNLFGSTECGATLMSIGSRARSGALLRPLEGTSYAFIPIDNGAQSGHQSTARMLEFVVLADSPDCPHPSLRMEDGHFHTGDLFQEAEPGSGTYIFRGRDDDWIKSENSLRCDTKSIEDNVRLMCGNLIAECIVVGAGRPSPALFIEPSVTMDHEKLRKEVIRKTRQFHSRRYLHERITSTKMIIVVPAGTLPRTATKGNIRRKAVEEQYRTLLDELYGCA